MKNNQLTFALVGVLFLTTLGTAVLSFKYVSSMRRFQAVQIRLLLLNNTRSFLTQLINDSAEYGKKDSSINPILQSIMSPNPNANPAAVLPPKSN